MSRAGRALNIHIVQTVHFSPLVVAAIVAIARVVVEGQRIATADFEGKRSAATRIGEHTVKLIVFLEKTGIFLLEFSNFCERGWKSRHLLWGESQRCLELCDGLLELLDVSFSFCAMPRLGLGVTAALRALRVCRMTAYRGHQCCNVS